jgi:hypothetical protein
MKTFIVALAFLALQAAPAMAEQKPRPTGWYWQCQLFSCDWYFVANCKTDPGLTECRRKRSQQGNKRPPKPPVELNLRGDGGCIKVDTPMFKLRECL